MGGGCAVAADENEGPGRGEDLIILVPSGRTIRAAIGVTIREALQQGGVPLAGSCGGEGRCGECRVRFVDRPPAPTGADLSALDSAEIEGGWRLACMHVLRGTVAIEVREAAGELDQKAKANAGAVASSISPEVSSREVCLDPASAGDPTAMAVRLRGAAGDKITVPLIALQRAASLIQSGSSIRSVIERQGEILDVHPCGAYEIHGLAVDVGTTTLGARLFHLPSGRQLAVAASRNPQCRFGADVISRIAHVRRGGSEGLSQLQEAAREGINALLEQLTSRAHVPGDSVYAVSVVGNPTMLHILLGVDPRGIDVSPYAPAFSEGVECRAREIGLAIHPHAVVRTLPAISAYVGADVVAGILATDLVGSGGRRLFLDVGTNGEIVLTVEGRLIACSTAAGPAFEGASIAQGMPALEGAIEAVRVEGNRVRCATVRDAAPRGICGSGLVSAVAELRRAGIIEPSGRFAARTGPLSDRLDGEGKRRRFRLTDGGESVYLYQSDVHEFQLAKAAIRAGIESLLREADLAAGALDGVLIGGAFSARLDAEHLVAIGLLPPVDVSRVRMAGDAAGRGAMLVLLDRKSAADARRIADRAEYVELSADKRFSDLFIEYLSLSLCA